MNSKLIKLITIAALTSSADAGFSLGKMFGTKVEKGQPIDHNSKKIIIEDGDQEIGELIYHPANFYPYTGEEYNQENNDDTQVVFDDEY